MRSQSRHPAERRQVFLITPQLVFKGASESGAGAKHRKPRLSAYFTLVQTKEVPSVQGTSSKHLGNKTESVGNGVGKVLLADEGAAGQSK